MNEDLLTSFKKELFDLNTPVRSSNGPTVRSSVKKSHISNNRIVIDDTPSPLLSKKFVSSKTHRSNKKKLHKKKRAHKDTPSKKVKKLLNPTQRLNENDTLPGVFNDDSELCENEVLGIHQFEPSANTPFTQIVPRTQHTPLTQTQTPISQKTQKTPSSLFKPKFQMNSNQDGTDNGGCDLSYESLRKLQRKRQNPYVVRLSEIFKIPVATLNEIRQQSEKSQSYSILEPRSSYSNNSDLSFTKVTQFFDTTGSKNAENILSQSQPKNDCQGAPDQLNETSRFENTMHERTRADKTANLNESVFNLSHFMGSLPRLDMTNLNEDEEIASSPIVIHAPLANQLDAHGSNALMALILARIDSVLASLTNLHKNKNQAESDQPLSNTFTNEEAKTLDNQILADLESLKNNENNITQLSHSILCEPKNPDGLEVMLTGMLTSRLLNESQNATLHTHIFDSTKLPNENLYVKDELNTPNVTDIFAPTPQTESFFENFQSEINKLPIDVKPTVNVIKDTQFVENVNKDTQSNGIIDTNVKFNPIDGRINPIIEQTSLKVPKKKAKKLLNVHAFLDDTLPGSSLDQSLKKSKSIKVKNDTPNLFKPKTSVDGGKKSDALISDKSPIVKPKKGKTKPKSAAKEDRKKKIKKNLDMTSKFNGKQMDPGNFCVSSVNATLSQKLQNLESPVELQMSDVMDQNMSRLTDKTNKLSKKLFKDPSKLSKSLKIKKRRSIKSENT